MTAVDALAVQPEEWTAVSGIHLVSDAMACGPLGLMVGFPPEL